MLSKNKNQKSNFSFLSIPCASFSPTHNPISHLLNNQRTYAHCTNTKKKVINYDSRGGISIETRKGEITTSHLLIQNADETNSGKYSCSPSNAIVASIRVHVLNGKWFTIIVICRPDQVERNKGI